MKKILLAAGTLVLAPQAADATTGLICRTGGEGPVHLALAVSHTAVPAVVSVRLTSNGREVPVVVAQSWFDPSEVRVDLTDRNAARHEARLRATWRAASRSYDGSLWRAGKRWWIRCREG
jgi:hypothetical protein